MGRLFRCPCCGYFTLDGINRYEVCPICRWEDAPEQRRDIDEWGGANKSSLRKARSNYKRFGACDKNMVRYSRFPNYGEIVEIMRKSPNRFVRIKFKDGRTIHGKVSGYWGQGDIKADGDVVEEPLLSVTDEQGNGYVAGIKDIMDIQTLNKKYYAPCYDAHTYSTDHKDELEGDTICGCFYCKRIFPPSEIKEWIPEEEDGEECTALCPYCEMDTVIGKSSGYPITKEFLKEMYERWFG